MKLNKILVLVVAFMLSVSFTSCKNEGKSEKIEVTTPKTEPQFKKEGVLSFISGNDTIKTIDIEIADTNADRSRGMMHRSSMDHDKGMLFIFNSEEEQSFWMKNTKLSLDIMYVNANKEIVSVYKHTQPYSLTPIPSIKPAIYVVETSAGFVDKFGIQVGDRIEFSKSYLPV